VRLTLPNLLLMQYLIYYLQKSEQRAAMSDGGVRGEACVGNLRSSHACTSKARKLERRLQRLASATCPLVSLVALAHRAVRLASAACALVSLLYWYKSTNTDAEALCCQLREWKVMRLASATCPLVTLADVC
jgi:hypothetical protein